MQPETETINDPGLIVLGLLLRLVKIDVSLPQLRGAVGNVPVGIPEMLRCAKYLGLKGRTLTSNWSRIGSTSLPAIATLKSGGYLLVGKYDRDKIIVLIPGAERPAAMSRADFEAHWDGRLLLIQKRSDLTKLLNPLAIMSRMRDMAARLIGGDGSRSSGEKIKALVQRTGEIGRALTLPREEARRRATEIAFLPAALEIVEAPPSPIGRTIAYSIIAIFVFVLAWSSFGTVDIVAVAPGKIIPSDRTKTIQPLEIGVVRAIRVQDGQSVKAGDVLVELDPTVNNATLDQSKRDFVGARLTAARVRAALTSADDPLSAFSAPADFPPEMVQMHRQFLVSQTSEQKAKLAAIDGQVAQRRAERTTIHASIEKLKTALEPLGQRVEVRKQLFDKQLGSKLTYLSDLQELVSHQQEIVVQQSRFNEADAAIGALLEMRARTAAEYQRMLYEELDKTEQKVAALAQEVVKAETRTKMQTLKAPVDGVVQQLAIHTVGGVVTPAQPLMIVVPAESQLEIDAMISNRDIGFVEPGQEAAIKVDTFNFTRYGLLHGAVLGVSQDAITRDKPQDRTNESARGSEASSSEPRGQELIYSARISVDRNQMQIDEKRVKLAPGMAVTVEIKTGTRRIISYLFSPLLRYKHESLRER
jgi:hemolysin D